MLTLKSRLRCACAAARLAVAAQSRVVRDEATRAVVEEAMPLEWAVVGVEAAATNLDGRKMTRRSAVGSR